jgi:hypothetical protein
VEPRLEKCKMLAGVGVGVRVPLRALTAHETATVVELSDRALALQEMLCCISVAVFGLTPSRLLVACSLSNENIRVSSSLCLKGDFDLPNTWVR